MLKQTQIDIKFNMNTAHKNLKVLPAVIKPFTYKPLHYFERI
jgi:hypothetical protein